MSLLSDEDLLEIVERKPRDYRKEALDYASEELDARGISFALAIAEAEKDQLEKLASPGKRFLNIPLDSVLILISWFVVVAFVGSANGLLCFGVVFLYNLAFETTIQKTPGKFLTHTRVLMLDGSKPDSASIAARTLIRFVPLEPWLLREGKWWHDKWSDTQVVSDE